MVKSKIDEYLDSALITRDEPVELIQPRKKKSKIELAGEDVMRHLMKLATNTDLSYREMAERISKIYELEITTTNVRLFFANNPAVIREMAEDRKKIAIIRADLLLEHNSVLVKDIRNLDEQIENLKKDDLVESDKKAKVIGDLLDKKGKLLLRHAKLSGKLQDNYGPEKVEVNLYQQITSEKSDIMQRLRKAEFKDEKVIDIKTNENKKTNP